MKTKKEPNTRKEEVETVNEPPRELTDEELEQVTGGELQYGGNAPPVEEEGFSSLNLRDLIAELEKRELT